MANHPGDHDGSRKLATGNSSRYIPRTMRLDELAAKIDAQVVGDGSIDVNAVAPLASAKPGQLSFLSNPKYAAELETTRASAVIVSLKHSTDHVALLKTRDPYYALQRAVVLLYGHRVHPHPGISPLAHVDPSAVVGAGTVIYPGAFVGPRAVVGRDCIIYPNVCIYDDSHIGDRVILHSGVAVGVDGYGFATHEGVHHKIPQVGRVVIEDDVEVGSNTAIERGALDDTRIGKGTKIDQLVVIGHGATIGEGCLIVAQVGIAGSVTLGHHVTLAGQVGVAGHLKIADHTVVAAQSGVMSDVDEKAVLMGSPAMPALHARRVYSIFTQLPDLLARIRTLEQQVQALSPEDDEDDRTPIV